jgi:hypothetical protein
MSAGNDGGLRLVFDAFPSPNGSRFIEAEDANGRSVNCGEWRARPDGLVELVIRELPGGVLLPLKHTPEMQSAWIDAMSKKDWTWADSYDAMLRARTGGDA